MGDDPKAKGSRPNYKSDEIQTTDPGEWLRLVEECGEIIHCEKRAARMHIRNCDILRKTTPSTSDVGYVDKSLRSINLCNFCPESMKRLSVKRFINYMKEQQQQNVREQ